MSGRSTRKRSRKRSRKAVEPKKVSEIRSSRNINHSLLNKASTVSRKEDAMRLIDEAIRESGLLKDIDPYPFSRVAYRKYTLDKLKDELKSIAHGDINENVIKNILYISEDDKLRKQAEQIKNSIEQKEDIIEEKKLKKRREQASKQREIDDEQDAEILGLRRDVRRVESQIEEKRLENELKRRPAILSQYSPNYPHAIPLSRPLNKPSQLYDIQGAPLAMDKQGVVHNLLVRRKSREMPKSSGSDVIDSVVEDVRRIANKLDTTRHLDPTQYTEKHEKAYHARVKRNVALGEGRKEHVKVKARKGVPKKKTATHRRR